MSLEIYGQTFKVKILCVLSSLLGHRLGVGAKLGLTRAELLPSEYNGGTQGQEREKHWTTEPKLVKRKCSCDVEIDSEEVGVSFHIIFLEGNWAKSVSF